MNSDELAERMETWALEHGSRGLPWRRTPRNPYHVIVSEAMLQQTRVDTVLRYYERFLDKFPTVDALAQAKEADVMKAWEGLGYYRRARLLHAGARAIAERGGLPRGRRELRALPGFGAYTSAAVACLAHDAPEVPVDGNLLRVAARLHDLEDDVAKAATHRRVEALLKRAFEVAASPRALAEAFFDLGRTVCTPRNPRCGDCPLEDVCLAKSRGTIPSRPVKTPAAGPRRVEVACALVRRPDGAVLVELREEGLLGGLWGLPWVEGDAAALEERYGFALGDVPSSLTLPYAYTHRVWTLAVHEATHDGEAPAGTRWVKAADVDALALAGAFRRVLEARLGE